MPNISQNNYVNNLNLIKEIFSGTFAVVTMMTGKLVNELATVSPLDDVNNESINNTSLPFDQSLNETLTATQYSPIAVATVVCFMTGIWEVIYIL